MMSSSLAGLPTALSSVIQITKSKTLGPNLDGHGFVPGYNKGGRWLSEDRTERPVGATILLMIYKRWHTARDSTTGLTPGSPGLRWVLELLYPDLLDWQNWLWTHRRAAPLGLAVAGSDPCVVPGTSSTEEWCKPSWGMGQLQGARFESLDNSPMYDAPAGYELWNATTHRMNLFDVGQTAAIAAECEALAEIADLLGGVDRAADAARLRQRRAQLGGQMDAHMWDEELGVFANVLTNGTRYPRISPTSFYTMWSGTASDVILEVAPFF